MIVFASMVFLASQKVRDPNGASEAPSRQPNWEETLPQRIDALTEALQRSGIELPAAVEERKGSGALRWVHRHYDVPASAEQEAAAQESLASLRQVDPGVSVSSTPRFDGIDVQVGLDGLLTHTIRFRWRNQEQRPRVALVIAPLGDDLGMARDCMSIDAPIAIAVQPFRPFSKEVAERGRMFDREVLLYIVVTQDDSDSANGVELSTKLKEAMESVPNAIGVTGGDGAGQADAKLRGKIREEATRLGLFYVRAQAAKQEGTDPAIVTLNSEQLTEPLTDQFAKLIAKARAVGAVVGVARPSREILSILPQQLSEWQADGVEVVPVSKLAAPAGLSAG
jgi:polysaccharide deacetylase 2 family uncharacterized protein YibQ